MRNTTTPTDTYGRQLNRGAFRLLMLIVALSLVVLGFMAFAGCAIGKAADGTPVAGFRVGDVDPETNQQAGTAAGAGIGGIVGGLIGGPAGAAAGEAAGGSLGWIVGGLLSVLGIGFAAKKSGDARAATAARAAADAAFDEGAARAGGVPVTQPARIVTVAAVDRPQS